MNNLIKSIIPNIIFYSGYVIILFGSKLTRLGSQLHINLKTEAGKKIIAAEESLKLMEERFKELEVMAKLKNTKKGFYIDGEGGNA